MKLAIFPGSFNPFHIGHRDIVNTALKVFDKVIILHLSNPAKPESSFRWTKDKYLPIPSCLDSVRQSDNVIVRIAETTTLVSELNQLVMDFPSLDIKNAAIIRGLRNSLDLENEKILKYSYEDMGLTQPIFYVLCSREYSHISSSGIRALEAIDENCHSSKS